MAGICNTCKYYKANVRPDEIKPHYCDFQDAPLSEEESRHNCDECIPKDERNKGCCH